MYPLDKRYSCVYLLLSNFDTPELIIAVVLSLLASSIFAIPPFSSWSIMVTLEFLISSGSESLNSLLSKSIFHTDNNPSLVLYSI